MIMSWYLQNKTKHDYVMIVSWLCHDICKTKQNMIIYHDYVCAKESENKTGCMSRI